MIKVEFNDVKLEIPESWRDIRLADYERLYMQNPETKLDQVRFVADVCGIDADMLLESPAQVFNTIAGIIDFVFDSELPPAASVKTNGKEYFISFADRLTLGEWVDAENVIGSDSESKLSELLAILCRPIGEKYNPDLAPERAEMFRNLPCDKALPLISFFLSRKRESEAILNHYSTVMAQAGRFLKDTKTFAINGGGIKRLPIWQRIRYTYLIRSLEKQLARCSDFSSTE
ncbi:hypothetical protein D0T84_16800 [Dysgonomonas sp. 521]|uniref:hypothetical protein n=1 Tax=Dysgonomonas sp. 521 TaxID=2302932 RepID=UPI0013D531C2|nr:hypothetical protein [Dysgonomonas sp. 521]NDV96561.1 hypothetical protein [Dysgonomonas sp. 521]